MPSDASTLRAEHDQVLAQLATRESTRRFAQGAVSLFVSLLVYGTAGKLAWDFWTTNPEWAIGAAVGATGLILYALVRLVQGRSLYRSERTQISRLLELRARLGVDAAPTGL